MNSGRPKILIVDDNISNLKIAKNVLNNDYDVYSVLSAAKMFDLLERQMPEIILLDIDMPEMNGFEAINILKNRAETRDIPVIFLTGKTDTASELEGLSLGAIDYIFKPFSPALLQKRIEVHLMVENQKRKLEEQTHILEKQQIELQNFNNNLQEMVEEKTYKVLQLQNAILSTVANLVESRDDITGAHIERTQYGLEILIKALKKENIYTGDIANWDIPLLLQSSQLHDVGKIIISDAILKKPGRLTEEEFAQMQTHTTMGAKIIDQIAANTEEDNFFLYAKIMAKTHHEKWDGSGYPCGLKGEAIPLAGRLMAIVDVYDALISERPYKKAFSHQEAMRIIEEGRGSHFDPIIVDIFVKVAAEFETMIKEVG